VIADHLGLSRPAVSRQLRILREAGLVRVSASWIDGRGLVYSLDPTTHGRITAWLAGTGIGLEAAIRAAAKPAAGDDADASGNPPAG
jgi:DNA-binding transcriptional ArsR family regulator